LPIPYCLAYGFVALEQIGRALRNGIRAAAWTFDESGYALDATNPNR